jgi:hypothetical protein
LGSAIPAHAQTASIGLALLDNSGGAGLAFDYSKPTSTTGDRTMGWVVDASFNHKGAGNALVSASLNTVIAQGGLRLQGKAGENLTWHVQGAAGIIHSSASVNILGSTGSGSNTTFVITPAGAVTYWFSPKRGVKGQLGIPFNGDGNFTRFDIAYVMNMK